MLSTDIQLKVEVNHLPGLNYALYQNHVPVITNLLITNNSLIELEDLKLSIIPSDEFADPYDSEIDVIQAESELDITEVRIRLDGKFFASLTEKIRETWWVKITIGEEVLFEHKYDIELFALDQWLGGSVLPEMLSSFVLPNIPELNAITHSAASYLKKWSDSSAFDEYQSHNPNRVKTQMASIYAAIKTQNILYNIAPASFGKMGQRIRLADSLLTNRIGNCLDMSLLYAAALENVGLNPIIVLIEGHAFVGAWLINETFPDSVNDDPSLLTKRMAAGIDEILLLEATCMNEGNQFTFDQAVESVNTHFQDLGKFNYFVDVKRSRSSEIYPLPQRKFNDNGLDLIEDTSFQPKEIDYTAPKEIKAGPRIQHVEHIDHGKQKLWERKLLDLSLRNNLLNLRLTRSSVQFIDVPIGELEDALFEGQEFQILHKPKDWENSLRDEGIYRAYSSNSPLAELVNKEFAQKRLRAYLSEDELHHRLTYLYRNARHSMEENGANTLYLAVGLLRWYESNRSERPRFAPILLIPVEIIRRSARVGYIIRGREEETVMNITLLEKLRQDFQLSISGLDKLPQDESGVDVQAIFSILRQAIMNMPRWDIEEQFFLGTFSFNKFILWNDIHSHTEYLKKNPVVRGLLEGKLDNALEVLELDNLDTHYKPSDVLLPIAADSSQLEAVCASMEGNSFILHGPPGTGKSQTITNIIANALYQGKRVLFVAEKMAALSVVYSRLQSIGLHPFCLELHSNKARKAEVLAQLKRSTEITRGKSPEDFELESNKINILKNEIDTVYKKLHRKEYHGFTLFEVLSNFIKYENIPGHFVAEDKFVDELTKEGISSFEDFIQQLEKAAIIAEGPTKEHPLFGIQLNNYSPTTRDELKELFSDAIESRSALVKDVKSLISYLGFEPTLGNKEKQNLIRIADLLLQLPDLPDTFFDIDDFKSFQKQLNPLLELAMENNQVREDFKNNFETSVFEIGAGDFLRTWKIKSQEWFIPKFFGQRKIKIYLQSYSDGRKISSEDVPQLLNQIKAFQERDNTLKEHTPFLETFCKGYSLQVNQDIETLIEGGDLFIKLEENLVAITSEEAVAVRTRKRLKSLLKTQNFKELLTSAIRAAKEDQEKINQVQKKIGREIPFNLHLDEDEGISLIRNWQTNIDKLKEWHAWTVIKGKADRYYLGKAIDELESGDIPHETISKSILKGVFHAMALRSLQESPELSVFSGEAFDARIEEFKRLNTKFSFLTKEVLFSHLAAKMPDFSRESSSNSETGILQRAIRSNGRGQSIRQLFKQVPHLLPRITPCMLMSPISVAQYVEIQQDPFDLVIFDEASQIPTCEAVGTIARGKQLIVVGDPKQMPPTNFFSSMHFDDEDQNEDLESILDDCEALSVPSKQLRWHYRSKHESLISFSNVKFYENSLFTFPSPDDLASRVKMVHVDGIYDRGKTRQNKAEALAIVNEIEKRLQVPKGERKSLGVVTFSSAQQTLIEDLLMERFREKPELEELAIQFNEPYFIKNLENVQGDERDIILFSVCYGPDQAGYVALNFGPLNRDGGWRRLNVAVSRARYEMIIFSTLKADQINLNRSKAEGVAGLKAFLGFAEKGRISLPAKSNKSFQGKGSPLAGSVASYLRNHGYDVDISVGASGFKVDVAVVNPENSQEYILGIVLDAKAHKSSKSSIDRLLVQQNVLELLGWNIHKVWSLEWWEFPVREGNKIMALLNDLMDRKAATLSTPQESSAIKSYSNDYIEAANSTQKLVEHDDVPAVDLSVYKKSNLAKSPYSQSEEFLDYGNTFKIIGQLKEIVETEAPILKSLLGRRILEIWGISRMGGRLQVRFDQLIEAAKLKFTIDNSEDYCFWKENQDPEKYSDFRVYAEDGTKRNADELPIVEVLNAVEKVLNQQISLPEMDLVRETAKVFGYARTGSIVLERMKLGISLLIEAGRAKIENDRIILI
ncbi:DUF3320 domain-containing protein [Echinicola rosea]|uniref:DNA helicase n=1 Tax=Echinicola rosea TaxID=1807691 RepID=A0ABQ1V9U6_9BACT|nr:DUF3320 domain-containing protein [Echinicola rosea]GGF42498.1 DNA helicase [Echinicola rosea]